MLACVCAAALCAGAAVRLTAGYGRGLRRARLLFADTGVPDQALAGPLRGRWAAEARARAGRLGREWLCLPPAVVLAVLGESVLPLIAGALAVPLMRRRLRAGERKRARERRADGIVALCGTAAGELRAGLQPVQALLAASAATGGLAGAEAAVLAAARFGGDVPRALRQAAGESGADGLVGLAACWRVAVDGGAGLAAGLDRLEAALRAERDQREALRAQLAGAWSTVVLLALLPVAGLLLGSALGADPLRVLLHTPAGWGLLLVGGALESVGLWWAARIVRAGEAS
ncbi:type II secretion system F family protein [Streptomyces sp. GMY02]|uniref:type II secretion system F family protein n=1 Tax=Streptomyces sp. GMY02 TaxID=1333528 RepID=UPI001C2BAE14|nr:type II secretion system F family protein [Streptomyces sp. GMY02]QXE35459.1 type II secretion system F family protein [Streptomyces sp. GMY02]